MITTQNTTATSTNHLVTEASTLGLKPGEWPIDLPTTLGNKQPFRRLRGMDDGGFEYHQQQGTLILRVFND